MNVWDGVVGVVRRSVRDGGGVAVCMYNVRGWAYENYRGVYICGVIGDVLC